MKSAVLLTMTISKDRWRKSKSVVQNWSYLVKFKYLLIVILLLPSHIAEVFSEQPTFRMPKYAEGEIPPPRSQAEVDSLLAGAQPLVEEKPLHVVLVAGPKDHDVGEHDYPNWQKVWSRLLAREEQTKVDTAWEFPDENQIDAADVLVFYQRGRWNDERAAAIDPFLARGGGAVYIHWAVDGRGGEQEMAKRIGLASLGGSIGYRHGPIHVDFSHNPHHPIARNLTEVDWVDESYWRFEEILHKSLSWGQVLRRESPAPCFGPLSTDADGCSFRSLGTTCGPLTIQFSGQSSCGIAWAGRRNVDRFNELVALDARID